MAQRGGKDLRDLKGLPRNAVGSYIRKAVDKRGPSAPVESGKAAPVLERFPALKLYNPKAWSDWMKSYVKNRLGPRHKFNYYEPLQAGAGVYPLRQASGPHVRLALAGDWGTGTDEARRVAAAMAATKPHFTIHLGDIYYVGSLAEVNEHVLGIDNPHNDYTPCTWPLGSVGSFALNGNHEMYGLGDAYFELLLPQLGLWHPRQRQEASFFCLENEDWRVIGLDTAYNAIGWPFLENLLNPRCHLEDQEIDWLRKAVRLKDPDDTRGVILLSHHRYLLGLRQLVSGRRAAALSVPEAARDLVLGTRASAQRVRPPRIQGRHRGARPVYRSRRHAGRPLGSGRAAAASRLRADVRRHAPVSE